MSCPFAHALGVPGQGVHAARIFGFARNDILATIVLAIVTSLAFRINILHSLVFWFVLGEVLHYVFGTNTAFLEWIGMSPKCS
jgi:hypothetical protein